MKIRNNTLEVIKPHGYVVLTDYMGTDLTPINSARASFAKRSTEFTAQDESLLSFLVRNEHLSPFRHAVLQFEICAPLIVARQLYKYIVGAANGESQDSLLAWNEGSFRYISQDLKFYIPEAHYWRGAPDNKKQGSKGSILPMEGLEATLLLAEHVHKSCEVFEELLAKGIAPEQARLVLPANALYTSWYLTISLQGFIHLIKERMDEHAMYETQQYANAMLDLARPAFPRSVAKLMA